MGRAGQFATARPANQWTAARAMGYAGVRVPSAAGPFGTAGTWADPSIRVSPPGTTRPKMAIFFNCPL